MIRDQIDATVFANTYGQTPAQTAAFAATCSVTHVRAYVEVNGEFGIIARFDAETRELLYSNIKSDHPAVAAMQAKAFAA